MKTSLLAAPWRRLRRPAGDLVQDCRGVAATEFAMIVPIMLLLFFGTVEFSSAVAVNRKVTLVTRTLSDLTSQSLNSVADSDLKNFFAASSSILTPYSPTPMTATISQIYIDGNKIAKIQWSKSATVSAAGGSPQATLVASPHKANDTVTVPAALLIPKTWLIWSEVGYTYMPITTYLLHAGIPLKNETYTRPRQSSCIDYPPPTSSNSVCDQVS